MKGLRWLAPEPSPNALRYTGSAGHVESYFLRLVDPDRPRALWLRATLFAPLTGEPVANTWFSWFDEASCRSSKGTGRMSEASFSPDGSEVAVADWRFSLGAPGAAGGSVSTKDLSASFDFTFRSLHSPVAAPFAFYPRVLRQGPFPRFKLNTPFPWLRFSGALTLDGERISLDGWEGAQGHNWGPEHALEYAWVQCTFPGAPGQPETLVEGATGRVKVLGRALPRLSAMVVRRGVHEYHFDTVVGVRQEATLAPTRYTVRLAGRDGALRLRADAGRHPMACLGYANPDGTLMYCFNSKLADVLLEVQPRGAEAFTCRSEHGGALEFLRPDAQPGALVT